jgi:hypothetical protein
MKIKPPLIVQAENHKDDLNMIIIPLFPDKNKNTPHQRFLASCIFNQIKKSPFGNFLAGPLGFEPRTSVLETDVLPLKLRAYNVRLT